MLAVEVSITRFVDEYQPGIVECKLIDAWEHEWSFIDKVPIFTTEQLDENSNYPVPGIINCETISEWHDTEGQKIITISTERPWGVESTTGNMRFDVLPQQLIDI